MAYIAIGGSTKSCEGCVDDDDIDGEEDMYNLSEPQNAIGSPARVTVSTKYGATVANAHKVEEKLKTLFFSEGDVWGESFNMGHFGQLKIYYGGNFSSLESLSEDGDEKGLNFPDITNLHWMKHGQIGHDNWPAQEGKIPPAPPEKLPVNTDAEAMKDLGLNLAAAITDSNRPKITPAEQKEQAVMGVKDTMLEMMSYDEDAVGNWERLEKVAQDCDDKKKKLEHLILVASGQIFASSFDFETHPVSISKFIQKFNRELKYFNRDVEADNDKVSTFDLSLLND